MAETAHCFICGRPHVRASMWKLDGWDQLYYVCVACVDVLREHARRRLAEEEHRPTDYDDIPF